MRYITIVSSFAALVLSIVSTTFVLLATTSPEWSTQSYYQASNGAASGNGQFDITPVCTASRSPFYKCGIPIVYENGTCHIPSCQFYPPYGYNATSCRSPAEFNGTWNYPNRAEVHYAGNLQIAASVFLTLGLILSLGLFAVPMVRQTWRDSEPEGATEPRAEETGGEDKTAGKFFRGGKTVRQHGHHHRPYPPLSHLGPAAYVFRARVLFLVIGVLLQLLAQFFGVLGLTVLASPTGAGAWIFQTMPGENFFVGHDWVIGKALNTYATIAWTTALLAAGIAGSSWGIPGRFW
ncbi:hypothetical protein GQ53DRAFT_835205 [Thozetella sp. PMI_491]|nr:hypothetical protein GQ53DRAFT_835205 [Thozetella sp. PMI_491]